MPYQNIPETKLDASISKLVGSLKGTFEENISVSLDDIKILFRNGCPDNRQTRELLSKLNNIGETSTNISDRLNRFRRIPSPLRSASKSIKTGVSVLKKIPFPPFFPGGIVADALTLVKELAIQLETSADSIEISISQASSLEKLQKEAANLGEKVNIALEVCQLSAEAGVSVDPELINQLVNGSDSESSNALKQLNKLVNGNLSLKAVENVSKKVSSEVDTFVAKDGKVYKLKVVQVPSDFTRAKRIQVLAESPKGELLYKSAKSFASSEEVLKKEVKFRIDNSQV